MTCTEMIIVLKFFHFLSVFLNERFAVVKRKFMFSFFVTYMHVLGWLQFYFLAGYGHGDRKSPLKSKQKQLATYKNFFQLISN